MRCDGVHLAGGAAWLPPAEPVEDALRDGRYDAEEQAANDYASITVAGDSDRDGPPRMAVRAAAVALARSGVDPEQVALVLHASLWFQGVTFWGAAAHVHDEVVPGNRHAPALDVQQMSNGGLGAVELAASYLMADRSRGAALVTTGDRFQLPGFDRWSSDLPGIVYGDGASAVVLSAEPGFARLLSVRTIVDTALEGVYRGDTTFAASPAAGDVPVANRRRRTEFAERVGPEFMAGRTQSGLQEAVLGATSDARCHLDDVARFVFPSVGREVMEKAYLPVLGVDLAATTFDIGRTTGHVGAGDQLIGLVRLVEQGELVAGDVVMLIGIGAGFSWTAAVVEILDAPDW